ncbi:GMC family oxidoreductase [Salinibacterium hongtaonis]|uniref:GMC family oxidoreductase n=1 Tax=Homoserinimonas hongtaonis TaxID=2079791 RepID=UPI000D3B8EDB|nr:GMC family oxidoreductase N-terminal domain-containing protein [Salinibacterium hongtaonis]AWB88617.1 GMC family oxidoreductase [Salinibacterium hongtaonis]
MSTALPAQVDVIVVGGGTSGNVVAARLAEAGRNVLVLEAGPDFGPFGDPRWPADILDATRLGHSNDWGYDSGDTLDVRVSFERARAIGGCSDFNGTTQTWGHRRDYDSWAEAGLEGWATDDLLPFFEAGTKAMRVKDYRVDELTSWQRVWFDAAPAVGIPQRHNLNDLDEGPAVAPESNNIVDGIRFNTAFAYLDPVRSLPNISIVGEAHVARVLVDRGVATGVEVLWRGESHIVRAQRVVVAGGAFNSPQVLQRSGIGNPDFVRSLDIPVVQPLRGVGENLHDQPFSLMSWAGSDRMTSEMDALRAEGWAPDEQAMGKAASSFDPDVFDLHFLPYSPTHRGDVKRWSCGVSALQPVSRGYVRITSRDPEAKPVIDHRFLSDPERRDARVLAEGMEILREMASQPGIRELVGEEIHPGISAVPTFDELVHFVERNPDNYWHPVGTCPMGSADDEKSVVDARGSVHGIEGLTVADCSIMPMIPRATTAMPAVVVGERIASFLVQN